MARRGQVGVGEGLKITIIGSVINIVLVVLKLVIGIMGNSRALVADAVHSMSDLVTDVIVFFGLLVGAKPRDETHHYGHGKVEVLAEMMLGAVLILAGLYIIHDAATALMAGELKPPSMLVLPAAFLSVVSKEWLYHATVRVARRTNYASLLANAWHHRSDAFSSIGVLAGAGLSIFSTSLVMADTVVAFVVALIIMQVGGKAIWTASLTIVDTAPSRDYMIRVGKMMMEVEGVRSVRDMKMRYVGRLIGVEVHLGLDPAISVQEGHDIAREVKRHVLEQDERIFDVLVHMEPEEGKK